ncbi:XdhC family protein [Desulfosporosinus meridiei]|uniref:Xanthine and CO dehydrogenases maturation factor, XdhC/CoxF family n=1 Tax=Desulfosporosinus meridiei (strain ATCC BAA-275 / DSM 13257 / KCTC 12902 / NCIMB 13706 / S10) TaxID=768704 RepID=J7IY71_DESMD|nr:XdhC/CoxI family protein [Desulfosporosinus meridiei]AFQ45084.1 xanthine and CO dehydrogenases maturation factor, XdhC/CoxF family [Desulfosporosinus meridiei DSM 13257]
MEETIINAVVKAQAKAILATIIRTEGSTPRDLGTQMLVMDTSQTIGTIGGGTAEKLITNRALALLTSNEEIYAEIFHQAINPESHTDKFSVCGATIDVLLEPIQDKNFWQFLQDLLKRGKDSVLVTSLVPPYSRSIFDTNGNLLLGQPQNEFVLSAIKRQEIISGKSAEVIGNSEEYRWFVDPVKKTERLLILGAGHMAREVAFYAKALDFQVSVIDDRPTFALPELFSCAHSVICSDFADGIKKYEPNRDTYVVIATRSHPTDGECLKEVLNFPTKYVGMLGSTKKIAAIVNFLRERGYSSQALASLKAPIGLDINAQTPSEIAISILAEIISVKRSLSSPQ